MNTNSRKKESGTILKSGFSLFAITTVFVALLALANIATRDAISAQLDTARTEALFYVLPGAARFSEQTMVNSQTGVLSYVIGYAADEPIGIVFDVSVTGWNPDLVFVVGINLDGEITGLQIVSHTETPGIGTLIEYYSFRGQFVGRTANIGIYGSAEYDGNQVATITGATISALVIIEGANAALEYFHNVAILEIAERYNVEAPEAPVFVEAEQNPLYSPPDDMLAVVLDADSFEDAVHVNANGIVSYRVGLVAGQPAGAVFVLSVRGWYPDVIFLVGINYNGEISGLEFIAHSETPEFGGYIERASFRNQFIGNTVGMELIPAGDTASDNQVAGITRATVSVEAVFNGANAALEYFVANVLPDLTRD